MENCAFSGHRDISPEKVLPLVELLKRSIAYAYEQGCRSFFCGGAVGFDTYAAKEVILFRVPNLRIRQHDLTALYRLRYHPRTNA